MKKMYIIAAIMFVAFIGIIWFIFFRNTSEINEFVEVSVNDEIVLKLYDMANPSNNVSTMGDIYKKQTFSNEFILGTSIVSYMKENKVKNSTITENDVYNQVRKVFGDITFAHNSGYIVSSELCAFQYDANRHLYTYLTGCDGNLDTKLVRKISKAKKSLTEYVITEKMIVVKNNEINVSEEEKYATLKIYNDLNESKLLDEKKYLIGTRPEVDIEDYIELASTYEYHFVFNGENYIYQSFQKVG